MVGRPRTRQLLSLPILLALSTTMVVAQLGEVGPTRIDLIELTWDPLPGTEGYHVYRGSIPVLAAGDYGECFKGSLQGTAASHDADPPLGEGYFYLVGAYDASGPGDLGLTPGGTARLPSIPCTASRRLLEFIEHLAPDGLPAREPLQNPAHEAWSSSREWTGVALHSGEFTLTAVDPVGGRAKPEAGQALAAIGSGGARFLPGRPVGALLPPAPLWPDGGAPPQAEVDAEVGDELGVGQAIAINVATATTEATISDGATLTAGGDITLTATSDHTVKDKLGVGQAIAINVATTTSEAAIGDGATLSGSASITLSATSDHAVESEKNPGPRILDRSGWLQRMIDRYMRRHHSRVPGMERHYRSQISYDGPLGHGWDFTANARLEPAGSDVVWLDGTGRRWLFHRVSATEFISPMGCYAKLWEDGAYFYIRYPDGTIQDYALFDGSNIQGALLRHITVDGRATIYFHDHQGLLEKIEDDLGRATTFAYDAEGRITSVSDFEGRTVEYGYDPEGNLVTVRSPAITGTPTGNDFPSGKTTTYSYTSGHPDPRFNHNLWTITSPNEEGSGAPFLVNGYEMDPNAWASDRVVSQTIGGTGSGGIPAGGLMTYGYVPLNPGGDPFDMALPRREVTVTDRMGNERIWLVNAAGNPIQLTERTNRGLRPGEPDYVTSASYNGDGEVTLLVLPEGNEVEMTYDRPGADRYREGDLLELRLRPDQASAGGRGDGHGADLPDIVWGYSYDPLGRRISRMTDPLGRQTFWTFDYQEGDPNTNGLAWLTTHYALDTGGVAFGLGDLNGDGVTGIAMGKPVVVELPTVDLAPGSNQAAIEGDLLQEIRAVLTWNLHGQLTSLLDPEGNLHLLEYHPESDPDGDGLPTPPPGSRTLDTSTGGYLRAVFLDTLSAPGRDNGTNPAPVAVECNYSYDPVGNRISDVDWRGVRTSRIFNQLDQVVELRRASATGTLGGPHGDPATGRGETGLAPLGYRVLYLYDADDNLTERRVEEVDGVTGAGPWIETHWTHDILDNVTSVAREVTGGLFVTTDIRYDANQSVDYLKEPVGNTREWLYDERDLLLSATRGASGPRGGVPSTRQYEYDGNGNLTRLIDGRGGLTDFVYDGADRLAGTVDQIGSTAGIWRDPAASVTQVALRGPAGGTTPPDRSGATNVDLSLSTYSYDALNRLVAEESWLAVVSGPAPVRSVMLQEGPLDPGDGMIDRLYEYDRLSRLTFVVVDTAATTRYDYDGAGRLVAVDDAGTRNLELARDAAGNLVELVETEHPSTPGLATEWYPTTRFYDALDRLTMEVNSAGETWRLLYNSLDLVEMETDALGPPGGTVDRRSAAFAGFTVAVNAHGNVLDHEYDGLGRLVSSQRILTASGQGDGTTAPPPDTSNPANPDGLITTATIWDDNSLPQARVDDGGHLTSYEYDNLDRRVRIVADDGTERQIAYDGEDNVIQTQDAVGSVITWTRDPAHRLVSASVTPASGVAGSTAQGFEYDGLGHLTRATDINQPSDATDDTEVQFTYDSLGRVVEEHQSLGGGAPLTTSFGWMAEGLRTDIITPSSVQTGYAYDAAGRLEAVSDGVASATFGYFGRDRVHTIEYGNGMRATMLDDSGTLDIGYDSARRIVVLRDIDPNFTNLAGYYYTRDRDGRILVVRRLHAPDPNGYAGEIHAYDSAGRLIEWGEGLINSFNSFLGPPTATRDWRLDGAGSWAGNTVDGVGMENTPNNNNEYDEMQAAGTRVDDGVADDFADPSGTPFPDGINLAHDMNGSQVRDGTYDLHYDAFGRLVEAARPPPFPGGTAYTYDPLGRRIAREVTGGGALDTWRRYLYDGSRVVEEQDPNGGVTRTVAFGRSAAECLWQGDGVSHQYYIQDAVGSTVGMADDAFPDVIERVVYTPHGQPRFTDPANSPLYDPNGVPLAASTVGNPLLFHGMRHDPETGGCPGGGWGPECGGLYVTLHRYYNPYQGRFLSRDPLGVWADRSSAGNSYAYAGGDPVNGSDPLGLGPLDDVDVDLPSGSLVRVEGAPLGIEILGQTLTGQFTFERETTPAGTPVKPAASEVELSLKPKKLVITPEAGEHIEVLFNPPEYTITKVVPWRQRGPRVSTEPTSPKR